MLDLSDIELQKTQAPPSFRQPRFPTRLIIAAIVIVVAGAAAWFFLAFRQRPEPASESAQAQPKTVQERPLGGAAEAVPLPPLDGTDALMRKLVSALSSHPVVAAWLTTDGLIRNFVVVVENIANSATPARHLTPLRPQGGFRVIDGDDELLIDPRSYDRYTPIAAAVDSVDAEGAARLYSTLKPRIEEAYAELGREGSFDRALEQAIVAMLRTPVLDGDVLLVPKGARVYGFDNDAIEGLTPAQKHLARMGPRNVRVIQARLRQIAVALGIPPAR